MIDIDDDPDDEPEREPDESPGEDPYEVAKRILQLEPGEAVRQYPDRARRIADRAREKGLTEAAEAIDARIDLALEGEL